METIDLSDDRRHAHADDADAEVFKVVLIGPSGTGKTAIFTRYCQGLFAEYSPSTIGVDFAIRRLTVNGQAVKLHLYDSAGAERFRSMTSNAYRTAHGIVLVYDLTSGETFRDLRFWANEIDRYAPRTATSLLVGNKSDLQPARRAITPEQAGEYAYNLPNNAGFIETSAKDASNIELAFEILVLHMLKQRGRERAAAHADRGAASVVADSHSDTTRGRRLLGRCCS